jgi:lipoprotein-anchoring transpeptidase ErfK/SrfK
LHMPMSDEQRVSVKERLSKLAAEWLFSPVVFSNDMLCDMYKIKPGNQLRIVGERHKVPWEILKEVNRIQRPELLQAGKVIKVINGPFHAKIYRSAFVLDLYLQNTFVRSFPVGLGKPGRETPTGLWRVKAGGKLVKPPWWDEETGRTYRPGDPDYPLGSRWIELEGVAGAAKDREGFGIHGTKEPDQIGKAESRGCIRLHNGDAILVYNLLVPVFSTVEVLD